MRVDDVERVPTHMRNFQRRIVGLDGAHLAFDPAEPRRFNELEPALA